MSRATPGNNESFQFSVFSFQFAFLQGLKTEN